MKKEFLEKRLVFENPESMNPQQTEIKEDDFVEQQRLDNLKQNIFDIDKFSEFALNPGAKEVFMKATGSPDRFKVLMMNMFMLRNNYLEGVYTQDEFRKIVESYNDGYKKTDKFNTKITIDVFNLEALTSK